MTLMYGWMDVNMDGQSHKSCRRSHEETPGTENQRRGTSAHTPRTESQ